MARPKNSQSKKTLTPDDFDTQMKEFLERVKAVVTKDTATGRATFPDFVLTQVIREKLGSALAALNTGDLEQAFETLWNADTHFQNQQAAYARGLLSDLQDDLADMTRAKADEDLVATVRSAVTEYEKHVGQGRFGLLEASRLFWAAIDALDKAEKEFVERQRAAAAEARARTKERCKTVASGLREMVSAI